VGAVAAGHEAVRGLDGRRLGRHTGQQTALQCGGDGVLAGEAAGVVDAHRRARGELRRQGQVLLVEGLGPEAVPGPVEAGQPQQQPVHGQRRHDEGLHSGPGDELGARPVVEQPPAGRGHRVDQPRTQIGERLRVGRGAREVTGAAHRIGAVLPVITGLERGTPHRQPDRDRAHGRVPGEDGLHQVDRDGVREAGHRHVGQFLRGAQRVQRAADTGPRDVQQIQFPPLADVFRDVVDHRGDADGQTALPQGVPGDGVVVPVARIGRRDRGNRAVEDRGIGGQHLAHDRRERHPGVQVLDGRPDHPFLGQTAHGQDRGVGPPDTQVRAVHLETGPGLVEQDLLEVARAVRHAVAGARAGHGPHPGSLVTRHGRPHLSSPGARPTDARGRRSGVRRPRSQGGGGSDAGRRRPTTTRRGQVPGHTTPRRSVGQALRQLTHRIVRRATRGPGAGSAR
jgi:hypothetical protein